MKETEVEIIWYGPRQTPFNFSITKLVKTISLPTKIVKKWKAGQKVVIEEKEYIVAVEILPNHGVRSLCELSEPLIKKHKKNKKKTKKKRDNSE